MYLNYISFAFVLYAACGMVVFRLKRRKYFWIKLAASSVVYWVFAFLCEYFGMWKMGLHIDWFYFNYIISAFICFGIIFICFKTSFSCALFYMTIGYTVEHISSGILGLIMSAASISYKWQWLLRLACGIIVIAVMYLFLIRRERQGLDKGSLLLPKTSTIIVSVISVLFIYVLSMYADNLIRQQANGIFINLSSLGYSLLLVIVQFGIFSHSKIKEEKDIVSRAIVEEREQYKLSQENIEKINIKCHDLKHRIDSLRNADDRDRVEQIEELENLLKIYEAGFRTGNSALDEVLTKKALQCIDLDIKLLPIIDGSAVSALKDDDIYSLFGNILDNAIEYLATVSDESLREINLKITNKNKLSIIHCENYCSTPLKFKGGLPVTTKRDTDNHGFGMASIKNIVNKYKGTLSIMQEDDNYILNIIIPA